MNKTNNILEQLNYMYDSKNGGFINPTTFPNLINDVNNLFVNQVTLGNKTEEEIESYKANQISNTSVFSFEYIGLDTVSEKLNNNIDRLVVNKSKVM